MIPRRETDFILYEWLKVESLFVREKFQDHSRETASALIDLSERLSSDLFLTHYKKSDVLEPSLDAAGVHVLPEVGTALRRYAELGLFAAGFSPDLGGMGYPQIVCAASFAIFAAANIATSAYAMLTVANARLISIFGTLAQIETFAMPQIRGQWFGTMCLSESQAGSSLADIRTRAVFEKEDELGARFRITGNKMWISGGDQDISENIVHLVLAKVPDATGALPEGTGGISLFIVPKFLPDRSRNDVIVAGLNHKMGYRGTVNTLLNFGENSGAIGWLVGSVGDGLRIMFMMMNEARINVGLGAAALAYRGYRHSLAYALERRQGRKIGVRKGDPIPIANHPDVKRQLLAQKAYAEGALALCLVGALLVDQDDDPSAKALLGLLTPVIKTWSSEYGLAANDLAIQIHGGYGYTRDFDVEQLYRDNRLNPIHEGTSAIQAIDLLGRKVLGKDNAGISELAARISRTRASASTLPGLSDFAAKLDTAWQHVEKVTTALGNMQGAEAFDHATLFLWAFGHTVVAWLWLDQGVIAHEHLATAANNDKNFYQGKLAAASYFFEYELPKVRMWLNMIMSGASLISSVSAEVL